MYIINFKYKNGPGVKWPDPTYTPDATPVGTDNCDQIMNVDSHATGDSPAINILDIVYLINYKYKNGPAPTCMRYYH